MRSIFTILALFILNLTIAQPINYNFSRYDSIPVSVNSINLKYPWAGGINYSQYSNIDLNFDGKQDLFVFDRTGNKVLTFVYSGTGNTIEYTYAPEYELQFPNMTNWALLVDYNCDNLPDIFTSTPGGIRIYKNTSTGNVISFQMVESLLYSYYFSGMVNLYVSSVDIPAIIDVDDDGDIDVLTFGLVGAKVEYHKNYSVENGYGCDSLLFQLRNECWGNFTESAFNNQLTLFDTCANNLGTVELDNLDHPNIFDDNTAHLSTTYIEAEGQRHSGSCLLAFDNNGINSKDLLIGDISAKNLVYAENGGTGVNLASSIISQDSLFPSYDTPVNIQTMACAFHVDINNDGEKDLIVTPQTTALSENKKGVWLYENLATTTNPDFNFQTIDFLQGDMIDRGEGSLPVLFDYDNDGLLDLFVSNYGEFNNSTNTYDCKLALFKNNGTATAPSFVQVNDNFENLASTMNDNSLHPTFGDLDNDGDKDMIVGGYFGTLYYFENIATTGNPADYVLSQANLTDNTSSIIDVGLYSAPLLVDLDRDGDNDLIIGARTGALVYYENIGTASTFNFRHRTDTLGGLFVRQYGYFTGYSVPAIYDQGGKYQLIIGSQSGYIHHYDSIENNIYGNYRMVDTMLLGAPHGIRSGVALADINNDGEMDIFTGNYRGGICFFKGDVNGTVGIKEEEEFAINIFPNPANQYFTIDAKQNQDLNVKLFDITGRVLFMTNFNANITIDISNFTSGIYLVEVTKKDLKLVHKIIKQ